MNNEIDPLVPFSIHRIDFDGAIAAIREMRIRYGIRRILLIGPSKSCRLVGMPTVDDYRLLGETILKIKNTVIDDDIEISWWCTTTLKSGDGGYIPVTDYNGKTSSISSCPLDEKFRRRFCDSVKAVAQIARPAMILFEDDYQLAGHPGLKFGCFCDRHIAQFNRETGTSFTRESLAEAFKTVTRQSIEYRKRYARLGAQSLIDFAREISGAVASVSPETRVGICQDGSWQRDGNATVELARGFAGINRPFVRLYSSSYSMDVATDFPLMMIFSRYCLSRFPSDIEYYLEVDTYPHNTYFASAGKVRTLTQLGLLSGADDFLYYATQHLNFPLEERTYLEYLHANRKRLNFLKKEAGKFTFSGPGIIYCPEAHCAIPCDNAHPFTMGSPWAYIMGRWGIAYSLADSDCMMLANPYNAMVLSEEEVMGLLHKGLVLDGSAARILVQRGFGKFLGVEESFEPLQPPSTEEVLDVADMEDLAGLNMYNFLAWPAGSEGGAYFTYKPLTGAEVVTIYRGHETLPAQPGMVRFENELGGRIVIMPLNLPSMSSNLFCHRKQKLMRKLIRWCAQTPLIAAMDGLPNTYLSASIDAERRNLLLCAMNLSPDRQGSFTVDLAPDFTGGHPLVLKDDQYVEVPWRWEGNQLTLTENFEILHPVIVKVEKGL